MASTTKLRLLFSCSHIGHTSACSVKFTMVQFQPHRCYLHLNNINKPLFIKKKTHHSPREDSISDYCVNFLKPGTIFTYILRRPPYLYEYMRDQADVSLFAIICLRKLHPSQILLYNNCLQLRYTALIVALGEKQTYSKNNTAFLLDIPRQKQGCHT